MRSNSIKRLILIILIVVLAGFLWFAKKVLNNMEIESKLKTVKIEDLKNEIDIEEEKSIGANKNKEQKTSDEEYEALARKELGLIKKDEIVIKPR